MKRRDFLKSGMLAGSFILFPEILKAVGSSLGSIGNKKLVIIQLAGGNDGLNTVVPYNNDIYYSSRPDIAVNKNEVLKLTDSLGFNPNLSKIKNLYDKGYLSIINNVGYENPNRSHFRSTDIWQTASKSNEYLSSGWIGRYIDKEGKIPYSGIEIDDSLSLIMKGDNINGIATNNPKVLYDNMNTPFIKEVQKIQDGNSNTHNLEYLYKTMSEAQSSAKEIFDKYKKTSDSFDYGNTPFGKQLKTTARLINSGVNTSIYFASMGGFDTHFSQEKRQSKLLSIYNDSIDIFIKDLEHNDTFKDTIIVTFSEFGRRVKQNSAMGTDHGTAGNVYVIGKDLKKPGFYNEDPNLSDLDSNGDLKYTVDFKSIYSTILGNWMNVDDKEILGRRYNKLDFI